MLVESSTLGGHVDGSNVATSKPGGVNAGFHAWNPLFDGDTMLALFLLITAKGTIVT